MSLPNSIHLIPQFLRDASIDSPIFRATVLKYTEQVDAIEKWLDVYVRSFQRVVNDVASLEDVINSVLQKTIPNNVSDLVMDQDYTYLAMKRFADGTRDFWWNFVQGAKKVEQNVLDPLTSLQREELKNFKDARRNLDVSQSKHDAALSRYLSQSKTKEPSALREDAFQLYETRKAYLRASLDFCVAAVLFKSAVDRTITKGFTDQWREHTRLRSNSQSAVEKYKNDMERLRSWIDTLENGEKIFKKQMLDARKDLEELVRKETMPARELDEYSATTVPYLSGKTSKSKDDAPSERQGWLFIRISTGKPARTVWTRRWFFLKDGIFGSLAGGIRSANVEQSEKIGVLLCNIKPAFAEDRRFCFEVKTKDNTIMLQAETQHELTAWMDAFEQAKRSALSSTSSSNQAFAIIPSTAATTESKHYDLLNIAHFHEESVSLGFDKKLVSPTAPAVRPSMDARGGGGGDEKAKPNGGTGGGVASLVMASHGALQSSQFVPSGLAHAATFNVSSSSDIVKDVGQLMPHTLAPGSLAPTPAPRGLAKAAAVTASRSPLDVSGIRTSALESARSHHRKTLSLDTNFPSKTKDGRSLELPPDYPDQLKVHDAQFRTLFPDAPGEPVLLVFRTSWTPAESQSLPGRCYVTASSIFFYAHVLGLVYTSSLHLDDICDVTAYSGKDCDFITLHLEPDSPIDHDLDRIVLKIYVEPLRLLQRRLHLMTRNARSTTDRLDSAELLRRLLALEKEPEEHHGAGSESWEELSIPYEERQNADMEGQSVFKVQLREDANRSREGLSRIKLPSHPVIYKPEGMDELPLEKEFDLSAKALFHVMFGDKSAVFQTLYHERRAQDIVQGAWEQVADSKRMQREFKYQITYYNFWKRQRQAVVTDYQTIDKQDEHLCYVVTDRKTPWHLPHQDSFMLITKIVITHVAKSKCKLSIWTAVEWADNAPALSRGVVQRQALLDLELDALDLGDVVADQARKLGSQSRTKKAVDVFGQIGQESPGQFTADSDPRTPRAQITHKRLSHMYLETVLSFTESALTTVIMWFFAGAKKAWDIATAHRLILALFAASMLTNMWLTSLSTVAYWNERRATKLMNRLGVVQNPIMSKAIYLRDLDDMLQNGTEFARYPSEQCYSKFKQLSNGTDRNAPWESAGEPYGSPATRALAQRFRRTRQNLGTYRHNLLVSLRMINRYERDVMMAEWENWLVEENQRCELAVGLLRGRRRRDDEEKEEVETRKKLGGQTVLSRNDEEVADLSPSAKKVLRDLEEYCSTCRTELEGLEISKVI